MSAFKWINMIYRRFIKKKLLSTPWRLIKNKQAYELTKLHCVWLPSHPHTQELCFLETAWLAAVCRKYIPLIVSSLMTAFIIIGCKHQFKKVSHKTPREDPKRRGLMRSHCTALSAPANTPCSQKAKLSSTAPPICKSQQVAREQDGLVGSRHSFETA